MLLEHYHALAQHEEYERRIQAFQLERKALKARDARGNALAKLAGRSLWLVARLGLAPWRWVRSAWSPAQWTQPLPNKPYRESSN
jgi:hypothetical protein